MTNFKNFNYIMINTFKKKSLNRILQEIYAKNKNASGKIAEFGAQHKSTKNFVNFINIKSASEVLFCDKFPKDSETSKQDLEVKLSFEDETFDNIIVFNVLEHVYDIKNAFSEINRCLKKDSCLIGSTPFIHRVHGAPDDFNRYTKQFIERVLLETNFKNIKVENFGYGPFTAAYTLVFDYLKFIPFLNNLLLAVSMTFDGLINKIIKTKTHNIYPVTICFSGEKK